jgi:hypothetical protein
VLGAAPGWAAQSNRHRHHANLQVLSEIPKHDGMQRTVISQPKPLARQVDRQPIVSDGPQAATVERIRDLAMAPTG